MPSKSRHFKLEYFRPGSLYSGASDYRRFTTLDYNLKSYIGIVGVGIISGWDIEEIDGNPLKIRITYGKGVINGYFAESPYYVRPRTNLDIGDIEIEVIRFDTIPEPYMSDQERLDYIEVIQAYDPSFVCPNPMENAYVKCIVYNDPNPERTSEITLEDNTDSYIYAEFPINWQPYPQLNDESYGTMDLTEPVAKNYPKYSDYLVALAQYQANKEAANAYQWQFYEENHFTEVVFKIYNKKQYSNSKVFLGVVTTRNGSITAIDTDGVDSLENMNATIKKKAASYLSKHIHGGDKDYDPPKINLETDIRECILNKYYPETGTTLFDISEKYYTSLEIGHKHSFIIDDNGNGQTIEHIGDGVKHFHTISEYVLSQPLTSYAAVEAHTHTIKDATTYVDGWTSDNLFNVYANKKLIGNQSSTNISLDLDKKQLTINGGIGVQYKQFRCEFEAYGAKYSFTKSAFSAYSFMLSLMADYYVKMANNINENPDASPIKASIVSNPSDSIDLIRQSQVADKSLVVSGDAFVYTAPVANNIKITASKTSSFSSPYKVTVEVLGNSEVTGLVGEGNIIYIHADKFIHGKFDIARIPFISHIGRLGETFSPYRLPIASKDGYRYKIIPYVTNIDSGHYHKIFVNIAGNGETTATAIGEDNVIYANGQDGNEYYIDHEHTISNFETAESGSDTFTDWRSTYSTETTPAAQTHTHVIDKIVLGDGKNVYAMAEDSSGNLWAGTSNYLIMKPYLPAYCFTINGEKIIRVGDDLWKLTQEAAGIYQNKYGPFTVDESYEQNVQDIEDELTSHNQYNIIYVKSSDGNVTTTMMITKLDYISFDNLYITELKQAYEIVDGDIILGIRLFNVETGEEVLLTDEKLPYYMVDGIIKPYYETKRNVSNSPFWDINISKRVSQDVDTICKSESGNNITTEDVNILSSEMLAFNYAITSDFNKEWNVMTLPSSMEILRKSMRDRNGNLWIISNNSISVSRIHMVGKNAETIENPSTSQTIYDILEAADGGIFCATNNGIYKTYDQGKTWTLDKRSEIGFIKIARDFSSDISTKVSGHTHTLEVNSYGDGFTSLPSSGTPHIHTINGWQIEESDSHVHEIKGEIYAIESDGTLYKRKTDGTWVSFGPFNFDEIGGLFAFNGSALLSTSNGLYKFNGVKWQFVNSEIPLSFSMSFDMASMFVGYYNKIKKTTDGNEFSVVYEFDGESQPFIENNEEKTYFGYAISNREASAYFESVTTPDDKSAIASFDKWLAADGAWGDSNLDLYFNNQLCYSVSKNVDQRGITAPYFKIDSENGIIDFSARTKTKAKTGLYDTNLVVDSSDDFRIGDRILVYNNNISPTSSEPAQDLWVSLTSVDADGQETEKTEEELVDEYTDVINGLIEYNKNAELLANDVIKYQSQYVVFDVISVGAGTIGISRPSDIELDSECIVHKLIPFGIDTDIKANIYESKITTSGNLTHDELENKITNIITGMPYKLGNSYFSNILQLTQATRYIYPDISQYFRNAKFYDMHYSNDELSENPPYIGNYIDTYNSYIHTQAYYDSEFSPKMANKINCIYLGKGDFNGVIFVGTNIGLMWSYYSDSREENWVYVPNVDFAVYSIRTHLQNKIMIGTERGVYVSENLREWDLLEEGSINFACHDVKLRWDDYSPVYINNVTIEFQNSVNEQNETNGVLLVAGDVSEILPNRRIKITDMSDNLVGTYSVSEVSSGRIDVVGEISPVPSTDNYNITMATWWGEFENEENTNPNLLNPVIAAGQNAISIALNPNNMIWQASNIEGVVDNFIAKGITPISSGTVLAAVNTTGDNEKSILIKSVDSGISWKQLKTFDSFYAKIDSFYATEDGHTMINISYSGNAPVQNGTQRLQMASFIGSSNEYKIIWNENDGENNTIYIYGTTIIEEINSFVGNTPLLKISPVNINAIAEYGDKIIIGTDSGIWSDDGTLNGSNVLNGIVTATGTKAIITSFDTNGVISSVSISDDGNTIVDINQLDSEIYNNQIQGGRLYIRNGIGSAEKFNVISNTSTRSQGEASFKINATYSSNWENYIGRKVIISKGNTKVFVSSNRTLINGEFNNGKAYFITEAQSSVILDIELSTKSYIELSSEVDFSSDTNGIIEGKQVLILNDKQEMVLYVSFSKNVENMSLIGAEIIPIDSSYSQYVFGKITIKSNELNKIVLNKVPMSSSKTNLLPFVFKSGDRFVISGGIIKPLNSFAFKTTSIDQGHYHNINLIGQEITGLITGISNNANVNYFDVAIQNISGFNNSLLSDQTLLDGEMAIFTNLNNPYIYYKRKVKSVNGSVIMIEKGEITEWDSDAYNEKLISEGWNISIDATTYGSTTNTLYSDFEKLRMKLTQDIDSGDTIVYVNSTAEFSAGNKVKLASTENKSEENVVNSILDSTRLTLRFSVEKSYLISEGAYISILSDSYANSHTHRIRKNRVQYLGVSDYHDLGYELNHSHETEPYIRKINCLDVYGDMIAAVGSSSKVYSSQNTTEWASNVDLNNSLEGGKDINSIHYVTFDSNGKIIAGADDMHLYFQSYSGTAVEDLDSPTFSV